MHEFNILHNIIPLITKLAEDNKLKSIKKITLRIGKLRQVNPDALKFAFKTLAENTIAFNAELAIIEVPIKVNCNSCNKEFIVAENIYICPHCDSTNIAIITGKEFILDKIEGET